MPQSDSWSELRRWSSAVPEVGLTLDVSRIGLTDAILARMRPALDQAFRAMAELERGAIANPDEKRRVGHYWLRSPELAPDAETGSTIRETVERIVAFADEVHSAGRFKRILVIGIGGSALGPQFVADALGGPGDPLVPSFLDNTDPDGIDRVLRGLGADLQRTLAYGRAGLEFGEHTVVVTGEGSALDRYAQEHRFVERFPMWDWVGGRTSETSAVGLLPAALQGVDIRAFLDGAAAMDRSTRSTDPHANPAALLALAWHHVGDGHGKRDMVILPYKDRLALLSRYLQQLVMESLGKARDLDGKLVEQGIAVYGNKGSTDQHAYVQQLRDGLPNFFVTFVRVLRDGPGPAIEVEPGTTSGDYLNGLLL
jgi:glucose-6-phosphate isomerase